MKLKIAKLFSLVKNNLLLASVIGGAVAGGAIFVVSNLIVTPSANVSAESLISSNNETKSTPIITETNSTQPSSEIVTETAPVPQTKPNTRMSVQQNESPLIVSDNISTNNEVETIVDNTLEPTTTDTKTPDEEKYYYLTFMLRNETYCLIDVDDDKGIPSVLQIPDTFNGIPVTSIESGILEDINTITTIVIPSTITDIGYNMCGISCQCHTLKAIICLGKDPFKLGTFSLDKYQLEGKQCLIYVPDDSVEKYTHLAEEGFRNSQNPRPYEQLITPISNLPQDLLSYIN